MTVLAKLADRFAETDIDQEIVVMRLDNGEFFSLAGTAASTWRLIDGTRDREALVTALAREYEGNPANIEADVDEFLEQLRGIGLLGES
jgi:pyrroloquinoline quinone biosynthesis protein D